METTSTSNTPAQQAANPSYHARILRRKQIEEAFGISRSTIYARLDPKSKQYDPDFPKPFPLSKTSGGTGAIGWLESECQAYIAHLVTTSRTSA